MEDKANPVDKLQLAKEVELVEKILAFAEKPETLACASHLSIELMKTQETNTFSSIDVNEYVLYRFDVQRAKQAKDLQGIEDAAINVGFALEEIDYDLRKARALLKDLG